MSSSAFSHVTNIMAQDLGFSEFTHDYGQTNELVLTLTPSQLEKYEDCKAILKYCCNKLEINHAQEGFFWVA